MAENKKTRRWSTTLKMGVAILIVLAVFSAIGYPALTGHTIVECEKEVQVPYEAQESYVEKEPYMAEECKDVQVPYTAEECHQEYFVYKEEFTKNEDTCTQQECASYNSVCAEYNFWGNCVRYNQVCSSYKCVKYRRDCVLKVTNQEKEATTFSLNLQKYSYDSRITTLVKTANLWVGPLDSSSTSWDFTHLPTESMTCTYNIVTVPTRNVCENVIKYRTERECSNATKYRDVTKYRTITKYRTDTLKSFSACFD